MANALRDFSFPAQTPHGERPMSNQTWKVAEAIGVEQARTLDEVLVLLDGGEPAHFVALFGSRGNASMLLSELTAARGLRTPGHRRLVGVVVDATEMPMHLETWQHLLLTVLDKIAESVHAPQETVIGLRRQLTELIQRERSGDESATFAAAAFAGQFRSALPGILDIAFSSTDQMLVVGLDKLDQVDGIFAHDLLEASRYFLSAPRCAALLAADELRLLDNLRVAVPDGDQTLAAWSTERIVVPERSTPSAKRAPLRPDAPKPEQAPTRRGRTDALAALPADAGKVIREALAPDQRAIESACHEWQAAMAALHKRHSDGMPTRLTGAQMAKLIALRLLSQRLFEAARLDVGLLTRLERAARSGTAEMNDENQRLMALSPKLTGLFKSAPNFIGIELRDAATAIRILTGTATGEFNVAPPTRSATRDAARAAAAPRTTAPVGAFIVSSVAIVVVDQLTKALSGAVPVTPNLTTSSLISSTLMLGLELTGLALALLILFFWGVARSSRAYHAAFGLITGALGSGLFDHIYLGGVVNFIEVGTFRLNVSHFGLLAGAALLLICMFRPQTDVVQVGE